LNFFESYPLLTWRRVAALSLCGSLFLSGCSQQPSSDLAVDNVAPSVIAHQGGVGQWPSNTLYAFQQADLLAGVDELEFDVHRTADKHIVLMHDTSVDRTTDGSGLLREMTLAQVAALDAGYRWTLDGEYFPFRGRDIKVPKLEAVFLQHPERAMSIEIKPDDTALAQHLCQLILKHNKGDQVKISSFHHDALVAFRKSCPAVKTSASNDEALWYVLASKVGLGGWFKPDAQFLQFPVKSGRLDVITPRFVAQAHRDGFLIDAWTINETEQMRYLIALGVDGIITDYPERLMSALEK